MQNDSVVQVENILTHSQKLEHDLKKVGMKVKHHEDNRKLLKTQINKIDESILDMQVTLAKYHSTIIGEGSQGANTKQTEQHTIECILKQDKAAAAIVCSMKIHQSIQLSKLPIANDVLGIVATLGKVNDDNISRLLAEYVGLEVMLAVVCKTCETVKALEEYDKNGVIDRNAGLHGLGPSIGRILEGRFFVICLENLRTYTGEFIADDPQRRLALLKPRLPSGECPPGFLGFAVNMIYVDPKYLSCVTANGHGLRETLFYSLFLHLQVYRTRTEMQLAIPFITDSAISLDGGIIKGTGLFSHGDRQEVEVRFPINSGVSNIPVNVIETEEELKLLQWKKERHVEDMQREEALLNRAKMLFGIKKQELLQHLTESTQYMAQENAQKRIQELEAQLLMAQGECTRLREELHGLEAELERVQRTRETGTSSSYGGSLGRLARELTTAEQRLQEALADSQAQESLEIALVEERSRLMQREQEWAAERASLEHQVQTSTGRIAQLEGEVARLQLHTDRDLQIRFERLQGQHDFSDRRIRELESQVKRTMTEQCRLEGKLGEQRGMRWMLEQKYASLKKKIGSQATDPFSYMGVLRSSARSLSIRSTAQSREKRKKTEEGDSMPPPQDEGGDEGGAPS